MPTLIVQKKWKIPTPDPRAQKYLCDALPIHPVVAQVLINRRISDPLEARDFMSSGPERFHDPFLMRDMAAAAARLQQAGKDREKVLVFGDYDVDGITASVVMRRGLEKAGCCVENHIPDRMSDGYGLNDSVVKTAQDAGASLVVTVDCGITAREEVAMLNNAGIDVIVVDHHEPSESGLPEALAVIDPKRADCPYPFKELAAVGLAAKVVQAVLGRLPDGVLDLVALGTIADVVSLRGENRALVRAGLPHIEKTVNTGLRALMASAGILGKAMRPYHAGFIIGPRINAAGRMESARIALDLLLSDDEEEAQLLADQLNTINKQRQQLQRRIIQEALDMAEKSINFNDQQVIVLAREGWHKGVLGIVASRICETYYRPAVIASLADGLATASARSIEGFHLHQALTHCHAQLEEYGGHRMAAGLRLRSASLEDFRTLINDYARDNLKPEHLVPTLTVDCEIPLQQLDLNLVYALDALEPYGEGNPRPLLCTRGLAIKSHPVVLGRQTLKFWVSDGQRAVSVIGFGMGKYKRDLKVGQIVDLVYEPSIDDWNKAPEVQLKLKDIRLVRT